jgi:shikimate dehydrogenase
VLGQPIGHSLSPVIHNAGYVAAGLSGWSYTAHECGSAGLASFVDELDDSWVGLSLTMPLKQQALLVAADVSPLAATIGAGNTLTRRGDGTWLAENTDAPGIVDAVRWDGQGGVGPGGVGPGGVGPGEVALLGAGGTARAALAAARACGAFVVRVYARRPGAVEELRGVADALGLRLLAAGWDEMARAGTASLIISTVPARAAAEHAGAIRWRPGGVLVDVIYDPWPTALATSAARGGWRVVSGLDVLLAQAARQFELFTAVPAPVAAMRTALDGALALRVGTENRGRVANRGRV